MPTPKLTVALAGIPEKLEAFAPALANVTALEGEKESVLGQAWLSAPNELITCGHVVADYLQSPQNLVIKFPASGNRYKVLEIKLHPSFVKQKDQLVKFDAAVLKLDLLSPEKEASPLPIRFAKPLRINQTVVAIRYPAHLGLISAAPSPLSQKGQILGYLRKHDNFHILHDLALAQGDSGSPIFDGTSVVAMHCGDTASLPGLNLPTTSIRLALWIDALRELNIKPTTADQSSAAMQPKSWRSYIDPLSTFVITSILTCILLLAGIAIVDMNKADWKTTNPTLLPVKIKLKQNPSGGSLIGSSIVSILPGSDCRAYVLSCNAETIELISSPLDLKANHEASVNFKNTDRLCVIITAPNVDLAKDRSDLTVKHTIPIKQFFDWLRNYESIHKGIVFYKLLTLS